MRRIGSKVARCLVVAVLCALPVQAMAAVNAANTVNSAAIIKADGTSGQTLTTGNGVKTGHIQNGAVTSAKIGDGAVTDAKIIGPISAAKIEAGVFQKKYANVIVVAKSGGDFTDPVEAVNSILDASAANPYLVKIMPGVYTISATAVVMKEYVDLEGSGQRITQVSGDGTLVIGASNSEIRSLTLNTSGTVMSCVDAYPTVTDIDMIGCLGISVSSQDLTKQLKLQNVNIVANSASGGYGINYNGSANVVVNNSTISANGVGINAAMGFLYINNSTINKSGENGFGVGLGSNVNGTILNSQIIANGNNAYGAVFNSSNVMISGSVISSASSKAITGSGPSSIVKIHNSSLNGFPAIYYNGMTVKCLNVFDSELNPVTCY